ncbi:hypothetical protein QT13_01690 [Pectobacterium brasiliense]|uniref:hypothetical protein n=1 Tax=Pectobacterium brasiliense TaxID=180957 RepID=UPI00057D4F32|nr:hypothetical protein [Pectobacterium brasiliense]KHS76980.1 hypothetical protein QT13_01690 [Pectobacterium brasiliense]
MDDETNNTISNTRHSRYYSGFFVGAIHHLERDMMRIPLPTPMLVAITAAFLFLFTMGIEYKNLISALINVIGFTICVSELVMRIVLYYRNKWRRHERF